MKVAAIDMERTKARELYKRYQSHRAHQTPADVEIQSIYKRIAQGHTVIRAFESIRAAGMNEQGLPKLAIMRADVKLCYLHQNTDQAVFSFERFHQSWRRAPRAKMPRELRMDWPGLKSSNIICEAIVPLIPVHLRPRRGIENYAILWEAEWTKRYPVDPYLLRRFGGDAWLVVAAWDLTDAERAVMSERVRAS
jgi:hypothetical protein